MISESEFGPDNIIHRSIVRNSDLLSVYLNVF
jgi:hypothetical protein